MGKNVSEGFSKRIPQYMQELWATGEVTGKMDETSDRLANITQEIADKKFDAVRDWVPRIIYAMVSIMIVMMILKLALGYNSLLTDIMGE